MKDWFEEKEEETVKVDPTKTKDWTPDNYWLAASSLPLMPTLADVIMGDIQ